MKRLLTFGTALSLCFVCVPLATAQGHDAPSVALSAGAGMAFPLHGDFDFNAPEWQLAIRGGGIGYMTLRRVSTDTVSERVPSVPSVCPNRESEFSNSSFSFQTAAGVDVFITSRAAAYAQFQSITPSEDAGSTHLSVIGGMRFRIW